jgi:hypothetical protein
MGITVECEAFCMPTFWVGWVKGLYAVGLPFILTSPLAPGLRGWRIFGGSGERMLLLESTKLTKNGTSVFFKATFCD